MTIETTHMKVQLLGGFRLSSAGRTLSVRPSTARLIAFLAIRGPRMRSDIVSAMWPDAAPQRALSTLRTVLWRLREDTPALVEEVSSVMLLRAQSDVAEVRTWGAAALSPTLEVRPYPANLGEDLLPGWEDQWLIEEREELRLLQLASLEMLAQHHLNTGRLGEAGRAAMAAVKIDPLRQSANRLLIEVHLRQGNDREALARYDRYRSALMSELGLDVGHELQSLVAPVLLSRRASAPVRDPAEASLRRNPRRA